MVATLFIAACAAVLGFVYGFYCAISIEDRD